MRPRSMGSILVAAVLAGLAAGLIVAVFHFVVTEPVIEQAIALEAMASHTAGVAAEEPLVSRPVQRAGLVLGMALYGVTWALLFGVAYALALRLAPGHGTFGRGLVVAGLGYWSVGLMTFLKYPATPPGVGDPETIAYRQGLYLGFLALSVLGAALAFALGQRPDRAKARAGRRLRGWLPGGAFLVVYSGTLLVVMPGNPDPVTMPSDVVGTFRALSLAGITLFWIALGLIFGLLSREDRPRQPGSKMARAWLATRAWVHIVTGRWKPPATLAKSAFADSRAQPAQAGFVGVAATSSRQAAGKTPVYTRPSQGRDH